MRIIGVDCAVAPENTGVVVARWEGGVLTVELGARGSEDRRPLEIILEAMEPTTLIAMDAPLGWPERFGELLAFHGAGHALPERAGRFFRRETDDVVARRLGKRPMDVAADRIGRTAYAALSLLDGVRRDGWRPTTLAWSPGEAATGVHAIETYPAGRLKATALPAQGYKRRDQRPVRRRILDALTEEINVGPEREGYLEDADQLDALLCAVSAADFLQGACPAPENLDRAKKEGWIWVPGALRNRQGS